MQSAPTRLALSLSLAGACLTYFAAIGCSDTSQDDPAPGGGSGGSGTGAGVGGSVHSAGASGSGTGATSGAGTTGGGAGTSANTGGTNNGSAGTNNGSAAASGSSIGGSAGVAGTGTTASGAGGLPSAGGMAGASGQSTTGGVAGAGEPVERPGLVTSGPDGYWKIGTLTAGSGAATVTVNDTAPKQDWIGFGGTFNEAGWHALAELSAEDRERAIRLLFSARDGANFKWGRIPIGASDYALDRYTLNENAGDYEMKMFSIARDKMHLIPFIKAAQAVKSDINFWASPWTPPTWMKDPPRMDATDANPDGTPATYPEAHIKDDAQTLTAYALYLARFVEEYALEGIPISGIFPQNEPGYATRYPSCRWAAGVMGKFIGDYLAPTLSTRGLDVEIWFGTLSNNESAVYSGHIGGLMGAAAEATTGVGLQWNTIGHVGELAQRGFLVMQTEHRCGNYPFSVPGTPAFNPDKPANDHAYAVESWGYIRDWLKAGVNVYSAWNMVLDTAGKNLDSIRPWPQNALLVVDRATDQLTVTPTYYVFRHLSYFVDPGAKRLDATGGDALAFKNPDGSLVAVVFNSGMGAAQTTVALGGSTYQVQVPGQGWATLYAKGS